jgi:hypothetical protein
MSVTSDVAAIIAECIKKPGRISVWSAKLGRYICSDDPAFAEAVTKPESSGRPAISPAFKLVFLTALTGTFLFIAICVTMTILAGKEMPPPQEKLVSGLFDLAKTGFGAIFGLLGGIILKPEIGN